MQWFSRVPTPWLLPVGRTAPPFELPDVHGRAVSLHGLLGQRALLLDFFFVACETCGPSLQLLESLRRQHGPAGLAVAAISRGDSAAALQRHAAQLELGMPLLVAADDDSVFHDYRVLVYPSTYLIDRSARIAYRRCGHDAAALRAALETLNFIA